MDAGAVTIKPRGAGTTSGSSAGSVALLAHTAAPAEILRGRERPATRYSCVKAVMRGGGLRSASRKPGWVPAAVSLVSGDPAGHPLYGRGLPVRSAAVTPLGRRRPPGLQVRPPSYARAKGGRFSPWAGPPGLVR